MKRKTNLLKNISYLFAPMMFVVLSACGKGGVLLSFPPASAPAHWIGTKQLGVSGRDAYFAAITSDNSGNIYVTGETDGALDGKTLTGNTDFLITKYDSNGAKEWTTLLGVATKDTQGRGITSDSSGNVYITGYTDGGLDGNALTGNYDLFVAKYNSSGTKQWVKQLGVSSAQTNGYAITSDSSSNIYITGRTAGGLDGNTLTGLSDLFVTKYNSNGVKQWTKQLGVASKSVLAVAITSTSAGNVYITGETNGSLDGNTLTGSHDLFVTKYNSSGVKQWTTQLGAASTYISADGVTLDSSENVYVTGFTDGGLDGNTLIGTQDSFITKYNSNGIKQWTKQFGLATHDLNAEAITFDGSGNVFITGETSGGLDGNTQTGTSDFFVTKYNLDGVKQWTKQLGVASKDTIGSAIISDSSGAVYISGQTGGGLDGNTLVGTNDAFITKYNSSGVKQ